MKIYMENSQWAENEIRILKEKVQSDKKRSYVFR